MSITPESRYKFVYVEGDKLPVNAITGSFYVLKNELYLAKSTTEYDLLSSKGFSIKEFKDYLTNQSGSIVEVFVDNLSGDDNNDGLSQSTAFKTIQKAIDGAKEWYRSYTISIVPGQYSEDIYVFGIKCDLFVMQKLGNDPTAFVDINSLCVQNCRNARFLNIGENDLDLSVHNSINCIFNCRTKTALFNNCNHIQSNLVIVNDLPSATPVFERCKDCLISLDFTELELLGILDCGVKSNNYSEITVKKAVGKVGSLFCIDGTSKGILTRNSNISGLVFDNFAGIDSFGEFISELDYITNKVNIPTTTIGVPVAIVPRANGEYDFEPVEVPVKDVKVNHVSVVKDGIADINIEADNTIIIIDNTEVNLKATIQPSQWVNNRVNISVSDLDIARNPVVGVPTGIDDQQNADNVVLSQIYVPVVTSTGITLHSNNIPTVPITVGIKYWRISNNLEPYKTNLKLLGQPDYSKQETINRISTNNGTWTVDRDGYIFLYIRTQANDAGAWIYGGLYINDKPILEHATPHTMYKDGDRVSRDVFLVSKGDIVRVTLQNIGTTGTTSRVTTIICNFIPAKNVDIPFVITGADLVSSNDVGKVKIDPDTKEMIVNGDVGSGSNTDNTFIIEPDLSKRETINRITTNNGTWTADRNGFVFLSVWGGATEGTQCTAYKNNEYYHSIGSYPGTGGNLVCIMPVTIGDIVKLVFKDTNNGAISNTGTQCFFIPPKIVWTNTDVTKFNTRLIGQPDYSNQETTNRISANNGTWTVDRDGFVYVYIRTQSNDVGGWVSGCAYINDKPAFDHFISYTQYKDSDLHSRRVLPVSKGDIIKVSLNNTGTTGNTHRIHTITCNFIPPKTVAPMFIKGADLVSSTEPGKVRIDPITKELIVNSGTLRDFGVIEYSLNEVATDYKWINGKTIYRKIIQGITPADTTLDVPFEILLDNPIDTLVSINGTLTVTHPLYIGRKYPLGMSDHRKGIEWVAFLIDSSTIEMSAFNEDGLFNSANYTLILEYTK
jgi:hypothetical protein